MSLQKNQWQVSLAVDGLVTSCWPPLSARCSSGASPTCWGRKRIYGYEVLVLGAVASALSPNVWWLIVFQCNLGIGISGDYPVSSTIMSEYAPKKTRGLLITPLFAMQAAGLIVGPALAVMLLASGPSHTLTWRLLLAFVAMAVFWMRRAMAETPRFLLASGRHRRAATC